MSIYIKDVSKITTFAAENNIKQYSTYYGKESTPNDSRRMGNRRQGQGRCNLPDPNTLHGLSQQHISALSTISMWRKCRLARWTNGQL